MKYNKVRSLFVVLLLLLVCCISGYTQGQVTQSGTSTTSRIGEKHNTLFSSRDTQVQTKSPYWIPGIQGQQTREFRTPYLMKVNEKLVAIASATLRPDSSQNHLGTIDFDSRISSDNGTTWNRSSERIQHQEFNRYSKDFSQFIQMNVYHPAFVLVESNNTPSEDSALYYISKNKEEKQSVLRILEVKHSENGGNGYSMGFSSVIVEFPFRHNYQDFVQFVGNTSSPILKMNSSGTLVFPVQLISTFKQIASGVMYFKPDEKVWRLEGVVLDEDTYNPAVVEWENDKLMMIAQHNSGYHRVYESTDLGKTWKESTGPLSRVWVNSPVLAGRGSQNNFITATIDEKRVILFTQSVKTNTGNELHLWLTNNSRIYHVGLISKGENATTSTLFFKNNKLYCLYETSEPAQYKVLFVDLKSGLDKIREVIKKWNYQDDNVSKGILHIDEACASSDCHIPTNGLVGYLSGNIADDKWKDEYLCVDADVRGATMNELNGLTFKGVGAGAMWPVSTSGPARQYYFTNKAFTLVATVTIHKLPTTSSSPLLGVKLKNSKNEILLGVSYNNNNTWTTTSKAAVKASVTKWELGKTYSVVLTFKEGGKGSVYINGTRLDVGDDLRITGGEEISHFYFGAYNETEQTDMTITNVMLYNRVLTTGEIEVLKNKLNISFKGEEAEKKLPEETTKFLKERKVLDSTPVEPVPKPNITANTSVTETATDPQPVPQTEQTVTPQPPPDQVEEKTQQTPNESVPVEESEKQTVQENTPENETTTETKAPVTITNKQQEDLLHKANLSGTINNVKTRRNNTTDGTVRVYGYGLPLFLLGLWALSTALP